MPTITIRDLEPAVKQRLRVLAARNGRSMEEEARAILRAAVSESERPVRGLGTAINRLFQAVGGVDLELPVREPMREPPKFK